MYALVLLVKQYSPPRRLIFYSFSLTIISYSLSYQERNRYLTEYADSVFVFSFQILLRDLLHHFV